jgi:hypothetical protein
VLLAAAGMLAACSSAGASSGSAASSSTGHGSGSASTVNATNWGASWVASLVKRAANSPGYLQPGSNPSVLPGPIIIADRNNSRILMISPKGQILWQFPDSASQAAGQVFKEPDDAFFGPHGTHIIATQESQFTISVISLKTGLITYHYGVPGTPGSAPGYLDNPDDALLLPDGGIFTADIKNCRLVALAPGATAPTTIFGETTNACYHNPPQRFGSPNGAFPMTDGNYLITEINGDWVDAMTPSGQILWSTHPPGFTYPSDSNEVSPGVYVSVDYTKPGGLETFNQQGQILWQYQPTSASGALNEPSLAMPLPNGDFLLNDDYNHRVIVVDPHTNQIVWQYGHTGVPGSAPGYLDKPDGVDLAPPNSLLMTHATTMGIPSGLPPVTASSASSAGSAPHTSKPSTKRRG